MIGRMIISRTDASLQMIIHAWNNKHNYISLHHKTKVVQNGIMNLFMSLVYESHLDKPNRLDSSGTLPAED